ncbi:MAG: hypothetical protein AMJ94_15835 [Deltaproteobacteria bacterium SM23_61]|nr:MAG: hypothetical protein AMJ94_15835 [Deltaproteobacteria bacterium SM23_61]
MGFKFIANLDAKFPLTFFIKFRIAAQTSMLKWFNPKGHGKVKPEAIVFPQCGGCGLYSQARPIDSEEL